MAHLCRVKSFVTIAFALVGCSSSPEPPKLKPAMVRGVVTLNGRPLSKGTVTFIPQEGGEEFGQPGLARIEPEGSFWIGNANLTKPAGLRPGRYKVTILSVTPRPEGPSGPIASLDIPPRYTEEETTPFDVIVTAGQNRFRLDLVTEESTAATANGVAR